MPEHAAPVHGEGGLLFSRAGLARASESCSGLCGVGGVCARVRVRACVQGDADGGGVVGLVWGVARYLQFTEQL